MTALERHLNAMWSLEPRQKNESVRLVKKVSFNILNHPNDAKFRNMSYLKISRAFRGSEPGLDFLLAAGFTRSSNGRRLVFHVKNVSQLQSAMKMLQEKEREASQSTNLNSGAGEGRREDEKESLGAACAFLQSLMDDGIQVDHALEAEIVDLNQDQIQSLRRELASKTKEEKLAFLAKNSEEIGGYVERVHRQRVELESELRDLLEEERRLNELTGAPQVEHDWSEFAKRTKQDQLSILVQKRDELVEDIAAKRKRLLSRSKDNMSGEIADCACHDSATICTWTRSILNELTFVESECKHYVRNEADPSMLKFLRYLEARGPTDQLHSMPSSLLSLMVKAVWNQNSPRLTGSGFERTSETIAFVNTFPFVMTADGELVSMCGQYRCVDGFMPSVAFSSSRKTPISSNLVPTVSECLKRGDVVLIQLVAPPTNSKEYSFTLGQIIDVVAGLHDNGEAKTILEYTVGINESEALDEGVDIIQSVLSKFMGESETIDRITLIHRLCTAWVSVDFGLMEKVNACAGRAMRHENDRLLRRWEDFGFVSPEARKDLETREVTFDEKLQDESSQCFSVELCKPHVVSRRDVVWSAHRADQRERRASRNERDKAIGLLMQLYHLPEFDFSSETSDLIGDDIDPELESRIHEDFEKRLEHARHLLVKKREFYEVVVFNAHKETALAFMSNGEGIPQWVFEREFWEQNASFIFLKKICEVYNAIPIGDRHTAKAMYRSHAVLEQFEYEAIDVPMISSRHTEAKNKAKSYRRVSEPIVSFRGVGNDSQQFDSPQATNRVRITQQLSSPERFEYECAMALKSVRPFGASRMHQFWSFLQNVVNDVASGGPVQLGADPFDFEFNQIMVSFDGIATVLEKLGFHPKNTERKRVYFASAGVDSSKLKAFKNAMTRVMPVARRQPLKKLTANPRPRRQSMVLIRNLREPTESVVVRDDPPQIPPPTCVSPSQRGSLVMRYEPSEAFVDELERIGKLAWTKHREVLEKLCLFCINTTTLRIGIITASDPRFRYLFEFDLTFLIQEMGYDWTGPDEMQMIPSKKCGEAILMVKQKCVDALRQSRNDGASTRSYQSKEELRHLVSEMYHRLSAKQAYLFFNELATMCKDVREFGKFRHRPNLEYLLLDEEMSLGLLGMLGFVIQDDRVALSGVKDCELKEFLAIPRKYLREPVASILGERSPTASPEQIRLRLRRTSLQPGLARFSPIRTHGRNSMSPQSDGIPGAPPVAIAPSEVNQRERPPISSWEISPPPPNQQPRPTIGMPRYPLPRSHGHVDQRHGFHYVQSEDEIRPQRGSPSMVHQHGRIEGGFLQAADQARQDNHRHDGDRHGGVGVINGGHFGDLNVSETSRRTE